ncbi:FAD-dependent oxidoreductase [Sporomusa termitida]|uniref:Ferredoxin--NADP reductase n=1 Tax=Sporomusa termitida TaxID=2377 RepID=A0A517DZ72_9FIRM|nr:FAD-dependent oxidoreductase [Sporomusa termitida]QDR82649.1 Ferredoxin--NADP reductase [Sporomusa termitida]
MIRYEVIIIGAGPAGLSAAIEAAARGLKVVVFDENDKPGGQLFKQIHKFFGAKEHQARERGFRIGERLLAQAVGLGVKVVLGAQVVGIFDNKQITVMIDTQMEYYVGNSIVIATGASENVISFPGWTLPGVIGAGAAQTLMNIYGLRPGSKVLMVGSGNVGVVVGYQLIQAGCQVAAVIDAAAHIGGYGVHAAKIARMGVPFYLSHTIAQAHGTDRVCGATIVEVDQAWQPVPGSEKFLDVDVICLAVGLSPMSQLARLAGCLLQDHPHKGGLVPVCDEYGETTVKDIYAAGDVAGIEEASSAMLQGRIAGNAIACRHGYISRTEFERYHAEYKTSLMQLRGGTFGHDGGEKTQPKHTAEGQPLSQTLLTKGYLDERELTVFPGIPGEAARKQGLVAVLECTQNIPCNPCQDVCPKGCIKVGDKITNLPVMVSSAHCSGCGLCVISCPGQAIFLVNETYADNFAAVSIPYELVPLPVPGSKGMACDRSGAVLAEAEVISVRKNAKSDGTALLTMKVPGQWAMLARFFKPGAALQEG